MQQPSKLPKPRKPREERDPTPEQVLQITEYVRQKNALDCRPPDPTTGIRKAYDLSAFLVYAKEIGFWRMKKEIEQTAEYYAKATTPPSDTSAIHRPSLIRFLFTSRGVIIWSM